MTTRRTKDRAATADRPRARKGSGRAARAAAAEAPTAEAPTAEAPGREEETLPGLAKGGDEQADCPTAGTGTGTGTGTGRTEERADCTTGSTVPGPVVVFEEEPADAAFEAAAGDSSAPEPGADAVVEPTVEVAAEPDSEPAVDPAAEAALEAVAADLRRGGRSVPQQLEALLFSTHVPLTTAEIAAALDLPVGEVAAAVAALEASLARRETAVALFEREKGGERALILDLKTAYRQDVAAVAPPLLKPVVTETLALVAMNQPLSQARLVRERGTGVYDHVKELLRRGLIQRQRRGRNYVLRTTDAFAGEFGLQNDPELIRRALARAAAIEGSTEVVGSHRVHMDDEGGATAERLLREAREAEARLAQARAAEARLAEARLAAREAEAREAEARQAALRTAEARAAADRSGGAGGASADDFEDCVVSGGEPPRRAVERRWAPGEERMSEPTRDTSGTETEQEQAADTSRIARVLSLIDDAATSDDW